VTWLVSLETCCQLEGEGLREQLCISAENSGLDGVHVLRACANFRMLAMTERKRSCAREVEARPKAEFLTLIP